MVLFSMQVALHGQWHFFFLNFVFCSDCADDDLMVIKGPTISLKTSIQNYQRPCQACLIFFVSDRYWSSKHWGGGKVTRHAALQLDRGGRGCTWAHPDLRRDPLARLLWHHVRLLALLPWNALRLHHLNPRTSPLGPHGALTVPEHPPVQDSAPRPPLVLRAAPLLQRRHVAVLRRRGAHCSRLLSRHQGNPNMQVNENIAFHFS